MCDKNVRGSVRVDIHLLLLITAQTGFELIKPSHGLPSQYTHLPLKGLQPSHFPCGPAPPRPTFDLAAKLVYLP
jgi:hypothetical protein